MSERGHIPESRQREKPRADLQWIGKSMKRVEDPRLLVGKGVYADDVNVPEMAHAAVLRSPHAHARIVSIDVSKAQALPGVLCVMTGADAAQVCDPLPTWASPPVLQSVIAHDRVRHVGEAVAAVAAEDRYIAEDACDLIEVVYEPLPPVVDPEEALTSDGRCRPAPRAWRHQYRARAQAHLRAGGGGFRGRRSGHRAPLPLAALGRPAAGDGGRRGELR